MVAIKQPRKRPEDLELIKNDVASFASSLGLSSATTPSSGFNDSDFRKTGHIAPNAQTRTKSKPENSVKIENKKAQKPKPNSKLSQVQSIDSRNNSFDKFKKLPKLPLVKSSALGVWYNDAAELEQKVIGENKKPDFKNVEEWKNLVEKKKELGERLLGQYVHEYESSRGQNGDIKMLVATQRSGTAADKVSAFSVMIGDNPVANIRSLDALLGMVTSKVGKRHALTAFEALQELFISSLLPDCKLKTIFQRPLNHLSDSKDSYSLLLLWYWEECLKERYDRFVSALEQASRDVLQALKSKSLKTIYVLLRSKPEQERRLLSALVNKLGDPDNKVASSADYHLAKLLADHPNMRAVVIEEVDNFLFRPHLGLRAKYHAVNFLSQIRLNHKGDGPKVAKRLVDVYFALFKVLISEPGEAHPTDKSSKGNKMPSVSSEDKKGNNSSESYVEMDSRLLSALLTGVNRAFPFVSSDEADDIVEVQTPMLFHLVHSRNFNVGLQALTLLDKISSKNQIVSDRFYRALYSKLLLPAALNSSKEEMFIGLLLRAMKNDVNIKRVAAFAKRLLQVAMQQPPQYACGCLFLLSEVLKAHATLWNMVLQNEFVDEDLEHFEDIVEDDNNQANLASDKQDNEGNTAQNSDGSNSENDSSADEAGSENSDSEEDDMSEEDDLLGGGSLHKPHVPKFDHDEPNVHPEHGRLTLPGGYNPRHREPAYCNADRASWWELTALASHVHPSVAAMARTLLSGANIVYNGNPLNDLSLSAFLDKFMEKKPKQTTWHGASQIEPAQKLDMNNQLIGAEILSLAETDVPPQDLIFHKFYMNKMNSLKKPKKKKKKTADDDLAEELYAAGPEEDESDNEEIENILDSGNPSLEADGNYDYDDLDKIANEDDEDLIGNVSDEETEAPSHVANEFPSDLDDDQIENADISFDDDDNESDDDDDIAIGEADDGSDLEEDIKDQKKRQRKQKSKRHDDIAMAEADDGSDLDNVQDQRKRKQKSRHHSAASPFASLEDYERLIDADKPTSDTSTQKERRKSKKKKRKMT